MTIVHFFNNNGIGKYGCLWTFQHGVVVFSLLLIQEQIDKTKKPKILTKTTYILLHNCTHSCEKIFTTKYKKNES